jgi:DNA (cytosine-5)-methyltransferase 1
VLGVDKRAQPDYPFAFRQADAIDYLAAGGWIGFDAIHASPPCQFASRGRKVGRGKLSHLAERPNLIPITRLGLQSIGLPYVIENVEGAAEWLANPVRLCGSTFGLTVERDGQTYALRRHRLFETNWLMFGAGDCDHSAPVLGVYHALNDQVQGIDHQTGRHVKGGRTVETVEEGQALMGIPWARWSGLKEAIPPAYTEWIGQQLRRQVTP